MGLDWTHLTQDHLPPQDHLLDSLLGAEEREVVDGRLGHLRVGLHPGGVD